MGQHRMHLQDRPRRTRLRGVAGTLAATLLVAATAIAVGPANAAAPPTTTYAADQFDSTSSCSDYRGDGPVVYYTVPADVSAVSVTAIGQAGGTGGDSTLHGGGSGGEGATVTAQVPVTPGEQLYISSTPGAAGFSASEGGYATFVSLDDVCGQTGSFPAQPVVVAAGGAGGGSADSFGPGGTGGSAGGYGSPGGSNEAHAGGGGSPGTSTGGGAGGVAAHGGNYTESGQDGTAWEAYFGGGGGTDSDGNGSGGGGGGGYFGGGGGGGSNGDGGGGGGGGSNYPAPGSPNAVEGLTSAQPSVSITPAAYLYSTATTLTASRPSSSPGQSVTYTATVTPDAGGAPSGSVAFTAALGTTTIQIGSSALADGSAAIQYALPDGRWTVTAAYAGASDESPSTSPGVSETVLPAAPSGLTGTRGGTAASISWSAPATGAGDPTTGYNVYEGTSAGGESSTPVNAAPVSATNFAVRGLVAGTTYHFTVETLDSTDSSAASTELALTPRAAVTGTTLAVTPPTAPDVFVVNFLNNHLTEVPAGGGPQTALGSGLSTPSGVAVDGAGDVFIADGLNERVVEEPAGGGPQVTVATGSFQLRTASGVAADAAGDVFIVDEENNRVVEVPAGGGTPTTVGSGLSNPLGVAVDAAGDVFIADAGNNRVVEVPADGGAQVTVGSGLSTPAAVAASAGGDVFIADAGNNRVIEVRAGGNTQTTVATGVYPLGVAVDAAGDLFIADAGHARVVEVPAGGGAQTVLGSGFTEPAAVALDIPAAQSTPGASVSLVATVASAPRGGAPTGVVDFTEGTTQLGSANLSGGSPDTATLNTSALATGSDQITATYAGDTYDHPSETGAPITVDVTTTPGPPPGLVAAAADAQAALSWVAPTSNGGAAITGYNVYEGATPGGESTIPVNASPVSAERYTVGGLTNGLTYYFTVRAVNSAGSSTPSNEASSRVRTVTGTTLATSPPPAPDLFIPNPVTNQVVETPAAGGPPTNVDTGPLSLDYPDGVALDAAGDVFIDDEVDDRVVEVPAAGGTPTAIDTGSFQLLYPEGLAVDTAGDLFIADTGHNRVIEVPTGGGTPTTVGSGLSVPRGLALDAAGDLFVADEGNGRVVEVQPVGGAQTTLDTQTFHLDHPIGVAVGAAGDIYIADTNNGRVVKVPAGGGAPSIVNAQQSQPMVPYGVAVDASGDVFIGDENHGHVIEVPAGGGQPSIVGVGDEPAVAVPVGQVVGAALTLTATVVSSPLGAAPAGTVTFTAGTAKLGTAALSGGFPDTATLTTTLAAGLDQLTATYAGDTDDQDSPASPPLTVNVATPAGSPTGLAAAGARGAPTAALSWSAPALTGGAPITGYDVYEGTSPGGESSIPVNASPVTATGYTLSGLANGTTYYFTVKAINVAGSSVSSGETSLTPGVPSSVSVLDTAVLGAQTGDTVTFTAEVSGAGGTPTGTIAWSLAGPGLPVCAVSTLVGAQASCTIVAGKAGAYSATATYGGDAVYTGSLGVDATASVSPATPSVTVADDSPASGSVATGGSLSFSATVAGPPAGAAPTGDLTWTVTGPGGAAVPCQPDVGTTASADVSTYGCSVSGVVAGPYSATASYAGDPDYLPSTGSDTATVIPAPLTITASDSSSTYGAAPVVTPAYSGFRNGDGPASLGTAPVCSSTISASTGVGSYAGANSCVGAADPDYAITYATGSGDVSPAGLSVTVSGGQTYGGGPWFEVKGYDGLAAGDSPSVLAGALGGCATSVASSSAVGSYAHTITGCGGLADADYAISYADGGFTVTPAPLTITPSSPSMVYGAAVPAIAPSYAGFVAGDTPASLGTPPSCSTTATSANTVDGSPYASSCTGAVDANYTIGYAPGFVGVTPAPLSVAVAGRQTYGGAATFAVAGYAGFVNGDAAANLDGSLAGCTTDVSTSAAVGGYALTISECAGLSDDDYVITYRDAGLTVQPAPLTITAGSATMRYGASVPTITPGYTGLAAGDTASALTSAAECSTIATPKSTVDGSPYATTCAGAADPNYSITYAAGSLGLTRAPLTVGVAGSAVYGGSARFAVTGYDGFANGDDAASLSGVLTGCSASARFAAAGWYPAMITGCAGLADDNYAVGYADEGFTIRAAPLTITASSVSMAYGTRVPAITPTYAGLVGGDTPSSLTTAPSCSTTAESTSPPGPYSTSCSGAGDQSYSTTYVAGTVTVSRAAMTLIYTGPRSAQSGERFIPTASLSSSANACRAARPVAFTMSVNPRTGTRAPYRLEAATSTADGVVDGRPISTVGWRAGRHTITASYAATAKCAGAVSREAFDVTDPMPSMTGSGRYRAPGAGTVQITFRAARVAGARPTVAGTLRLANQHRWLFVAGVSGYSQPTAISGSLGGKGELYWWNRALDSARGGWALAASGVSYTASFTDTTKSSPGAFGIGIAYAPRASQPGPLPNSVRIALTRGLIGLTGPTHG
jgi:sugar lactone lactonase YvrE